MKFFLTLLVLFPLVVNCQYDCPAKGTLCDVNGRNCTDPDHGPLVCDCNPGQNTCEQLFAGCGAYAIEDISSTATPSSFNVDQPVCPGEHNCYPVNLHSETGVQAQDICVNPPLPTGLSIAFGNIPTSHGNFLNGTPTVTMPSQTYTVIGKGSCPYIYRTSITFAVVPPNPNQCTESCLFSDLERQVCETDNSFRICYQNSPNTTILSDIVTCGINQYCQGGTCHCGSEQLCINSTSFYYCEATQSGVNGAATGVFNCPSGTTCDFTSNQCVGSSSSATSTTGPSSPPPASSTSGPFASGTPCSNSGYQRCTSSETYQTCTNGAWSANQQCQSGLTCTPSQNNIYCQ